MADDTGLSDKQIEALKSLVPIAEQLKKEAEYRKAVRIVLGSWKGTVITVAGFIGAVVVFREQIIILLGWTK